MRGHVVTACMACMIVTLANAGCTKYKEQIAALEQEKAALESDRAALEETKADLENRMAGLVEYQEALEAELEKLGGDKEKLSAEYTEAMDTLEQAQANLEATREKLAEAQAELDASLADLEAKQADIEKKEQIIAEMKKQEALAEERLATLKDMLARFKKLIEGGKLKVKIRDGKMVLELPSAILFESGKADLSDQGEETLAEVAIVLATIENREFQVAGHTDDVPIKTKKYPSNWELSTARAVAVVKFLQEQGVSPENLSAAGYSEYKPVRDNDTEEGKALNRRIEITLMPNLDELPDLSVLEAELD